MEVRQALTGHIQLPNSLCFSDLFFKENRTANDAVYKFPAASSGSLQTARFSSEPFQFAERQRSTGSIGGEVLEDAERDLIFAVFREVTAEHCGSEYFVSVGQGGTGIPSIAAKSSSGIKLFQRESPGIDAGVAACAAGLVTVAFQLFPEREAGVILLQLRHIRWRIFGGFSDDAAGQPCSAANRI